MPQTIRFLLLSLLAPVLCAAPQEGAGIFRRDNLVAWCIVPFDSVDRTPAQRAEMLQRLGFKKLAYDYRQQDIKDWDRELTELKARGIELTAWWFPRELNDEGRKALKLFADHGAKPQLWVSGFGEMQRDGTREQRISHEAVRVGRIARAAAPLGLRVALYNHGGWFGEPENQIAIIEKLKTDGISNVGIVYNLHHAHRHLDRLPELIRLMKPHLLAFNLNGMVRDGDRTGRKIEVLGKGELDAWCLRLLRDSGWQGPVGILNHVKTDSEQRLRENLAGLDSLLPRLDSTPVEMPQPPAAPREEQSH